MNNILSSDSISPVAFYALRKSGNKRFFPVSACPTDDVLYLYSKIPSYKVPENGMENYRVVIALDADRIGQSLKRVGTKHKVDVYICESTIFFTPQNASFLYEGKSAYQTCLIQAEQSLENKSFNLYQHGQIDHALEFKWDKSYCEKFVTRDPSQVQMDDAQIDRIKGAIVCYYAGLNRVNSPELATLRKDARKIKNIFSAIVNSPNKGLSPEQEGVLEPIVKEFYEVFSTVDPVSLRNKDAINSFLSSSKTLNANASVISREVILNIFDELGLTRGILQRLGLKEPFDIYSLYDIIGNNKIVDLFSMKTGEIDKALADIERYMSSSSECRIALGDYFNKSEKNELHITEKEVKLEFYNKLLNALIEGKHLDSTDQKPSLAIALLGGKILKSFYDEDKWSSSPSRGYINALLGNIQNGTPFDVLSDPHDILQAFAIFSLKGTDIEKLSDNLSQNGILEYKYAWGLYGAAYGYSQLPKTFTSRILKTELLEDIYRFLFPKCVLNSSSIAQETRDDQKGKGDPVLAIETPAFVESHGTDDCVVGAVVGVNVGTSKDQPEPSEMLRGKLNAVRYGKKSRPLTSNQIDQIVALFARSRQLFDEAFISKIRMVRGIGDESLMAIRDALNVHPIIAKDTSLFSDENNPRDFVTDKGLVDVVKELRIGDSNVERIILDDIKYVQDCHIKDSPRNDNECIKHLNNLLFSEKTKKHLKRTPNNEQIVETLIDILKIRYR